MIKTIIGLVITMGFFLLINEPVQAATWTVGSGGDAWSANVTMSNVNENASGYIDLYSTDVTAVNNRDSRLYSSKVNNNYGTEAKLQVGYYSSANRSVMSWTLPAGSGFISKIELFLYDYYRWSSDSSNTMKVYNLTTSFPSETGVTWNMALDQNLDGVVDAGDIDWTTDGGDYNTTEIDENTFIGNITAWYSWVLRGVGATNSIDSLTWGNSIELFIRSDSGPRIDYFVSKEATASDPFAGADSYKPYIKITYASSSGSITSNSKDAEMVGLSGDVWKQISFTGTVPVNTSVDIQVSSSDDNISWSSWNTVQSSATSGTTYEIPSVEWKRYGKWKLVLNTTTSSSPEIQSVTFTCDVNIFKGGSYDGHSVAGTSSDVAVGFGTATKLAFTTSPSNASPGTAFVTQPVVAVQDTYGNTVTTATNSVTLSISNNPGSGALSGTATVAAVSGVATFSGLSIDKEGDAYTLQAASGALTTVTSSSFNIVSLTTIRTAVTTVQTQVTNVQTDVTSIRQDTGTTLPATLSAISGKIDTMSTKVDSILEDTGTTLPATLTTITGKIDTIDNIVDEILIDTGTTLPAAITTAKTDIIAELDKGVKAKILNRETTVKSGDTITIRYKTASGLSPTIDVYDAGNTKRVDSAAMTQIGSTGVYEYDLTLTSGWGTGDYTVICSETTKSSVDSIVLTVTTSGAAVDLSAIDTKIDTLTTNLNTVSTNVSSVKTVVGTTSDTSTSSTLYGKLSGVTSNVSTIVTKWGSYTAADLLSDTSNLESYIGTPNDTAANNTVFGKIAQVYNTTGTISTASIYAQNAYNEIQKVRTELDFNGKTDTAYNLMVGLKDTISELRERIDRIPSEVATPSAGKIAASLNEALLALKERAVLAGYPGVAAEAEEVEVRPAEEGVVDLTTLKNQLSELKALLETIKELMTAEEEKPVIKTWLEMG